MQKTENRFKNDGRQRENINERTRESNSLQANYNEMNSQQFWNMG